MQLNAYHKSHPIFCMYAKRTGLQSKHFASYHLAPTQTHVSLLLQVNTHLEALSPPSSGGPWSSASCLCPAGPAKNSPLLGQSPHPEASPRTHSVLLREVTKVSPLKNPKSTKLHSSQVSCSSCPAGDPQQMDPAEQKLVQNVCGHAPRVNKWPKSHAMTTKIPKILLRQYLVILWSCEEWRPQRVPEKKQKWVACNACM